MKRLVYQIANLPKCPSLLGVVRTFICVTLLSILCPAFFVIAATKDVSKVELYAVVVGVGKYQDNRLTRLYFSSKDAVDFANFLEAHKSLFAKTHIRLFVDEAATRENVTKAIRNGIKPAGKDDIVIIYVSGHGTADPVRTDEYYFLTYDADPENLFGSALLMNSSGLFKGIDSDRIILVSDACHAGGFSAALDKSAVKAADVFFSVFQNLQGRFGLASSRPDESSLEIREKGKYENSVFTHYVLKGLQGAACRQAGTGLITLSDLYHYVYEETRKATHFKQNPQLYAAKGSAEDTPIFRVPVYHQPLNVKAVFATKDDQGQVIPVTNDSVLKSGQLFGLAFSADADCYVHVVWLDTQGNVGRLYPNPQLTEGTGEVKANSKYWLPSKQGKAWYVLDNHQGEETIYLVASRDRNPRMETLCDSLRSANLEREFNIMGFVDHTVPDKDMRLSAPDRERLFEKMENKIKVVGADAVIRLRFKHVAK